MELARAKIGKCMALGIYGDLPPGYEERVKAIAYEIHRDKSPSIGRGIIHQGIDLRSILRRDVQ